MKAEILAHLGRGPATAGDLQRALAVVSARQRGSFLRILRMLVRDRLVLGPERRRPWYQLAQRRATDGRYVASVDKA